MSFLTAIFNRTPAVTQTHLYYIYDPMCSWCWGFRETWQQMQEALSAMQDEQGEPIKVVPVLGGLRADDAPFMSEPAKNNAQVTWQRIQQGIPGTKFNYDLWQPGQPMRAPTYPACRAILAAGLQGEDYKEAMCLVIQQRYYLQAVMPVSDEALVSCAEFIGLDTQQFAADLHSEAVNHALFDEIELRERLFRQTGAKRFPSLVLAKRDGSVQRMSINYQQAEVNLATIAGQLLAKAS